MSEQAIGCTLLSCSCDGFKPGKLRRRQCEHCKHGWVAHALSKLKVQHLSQAGQVEIVHSSAVFDICTLMLYGTQAVPVRLKILLDRLFSVLQQDQVVQILNALDWTLQDYIRGYVLQDVTGRVVDRWVMMTLDEESAALQQFLRFGETRSIVELMAVQDRESRAVLVPAPRESSGIRAFIESSTRCSSAPVPAPPPSSSSSSSPSMHHFENLISSMAFLLPFQYLGSLPGPLLGSAPGPAPDSVLVGSSSASIDSDPERNGINAPKLEPGDLPASDAYSDGPSTPSVTSDPEGKLRPLAEQSSGGAGLRKGRVFCGACQKTFYDKGTLKIHHNAVHLQIKHRCTVPGCGMVFSSLRSRNRHSANPNPRLHLPTVQPVLPFYRSLATPTRIAPPPLISSSSFPTNHSAPSASDPDPVPKKKSRKSSVPVKFETLGAPPDSSGSGGERAAACYRDEAEEGGACYRDDAEEGGACYRDDAEEGGACYRDDAEEGGACYRDDAEVGGGARYRDNPEEGGACYRDDAEEGGGCYRDDAEGRGGACYQDNPEERGACYRDDVEEEGGGGACYRDDTEQEGGRGAGAERMQEGGVITSTFPQDPESSGSPAPPPEKPCHALEPSDCDHSPCPEVEPQPDGGKEERHCCEICSGTFQGAQAVEAHRCSASTHRISADPPLLPMVLGGAPCGGGVCRDTPTRLPQASPLPTPSSVIFNGRYRTSPVFPASKAAGNGLADEEEDEEEEEEEEEEAVLDLSATSVSQSGRGAQPPWDSDGGSGGAGEESNDGTSPWQSDDAPVTCPSPRQPGDAPITCPACRKAYSNRGTFRAHYRTVHLRLLHRCRVPGCDTTFSSLRSRNRHSQNPNLHRNLTGT
ncbi:hypothetical protein AAFF_G00067660 [Aldrovandia affinis]|uniref:C2H2-type domain-containing protein n=1 Tax=Aldrovandia affinis TaxID=143900 RepID=A0AAD7RZ80_9TELE|nr:hypothetical protein AAFF_G00067660 [Aldrovandia affinis]